MSMEEITFDELKTLTKVAKWYHNSADCNSGIQISIAKINDVEVGRRETENAQTKYFKAGVKASFYKVENSWQYTTIYSADGEPFCEFSLEWMDGLTEDTQDELDKVMQARVDHVLKLLNVPKPKGSDDGEN